MVRPRSAIEEDLVGFLRRSLPADARLVHDLVIGGCRTDVVAVLEDLLLVFLVRDRREGLDGLGDAVRAIAEVARSVTIVAHRRHFEETPCGGGRVRLSATVDGGRTLSLRTEAPSSGTVFTSLCSAGRKTPGILLVGCVSSGTRHTRAARTDARHSAKSSLPVKETPERVRDTFRNRWSS